MEEEEDKDKKNNPPPPPLPLPLLSEEEDESLDHVGEVNLIRYFRSKSLPFNAYNIPQDPQDLSESSYNSNHHNHHHHPHKSHPNNTSIDTGSQCSSSVFCSTDPGSNGSSGHSHHNHHHGHCHRNDPGCKPGSCEGGGGVGVKGGPTVNNVLKGGVIKGKAAGGGGSSGASGEQESGEGGGKSRRMDWRTLQQHYYPEGGFGYIITFCAFLAHAIATGVQIYLSNIVFHRFHAGWLGSVSMGISLFLSPLWVSICKRKSTRLSAVFGGLLSSLGLLFASFGTKLHQVCISYAGFIGVGVGLTRDASSLMVGQYFKRKRDLVEILVVSGSGMGMVLMPISMHGAVGSLGWRLGLQAMTGTCFLAFILGTCYRSASLYHPQRRAILHLKNQKRKIKDKEKREEKPPFIDFKCLRSKTLQILLVSNAFTAFGINTPLFHMVLECKAVGEDYTSLVLLHVYMGVSWILGCGMFGLLVIQKSQECRVSKQYLCQMASVISSISIISLTAVEGFGGLVIFSWVYGFTLGAYNYALKVYTYERVRARHFPRAWSFVQWSQSIPLVVGVPLTGHMNTVIGWKSGYYLSALSVFVGSAFLFLTDVRRRRLSRRKTPNSSVKTNQTTTDTSLLSPKPRKLSFSYPLEKYPSGPPSKERDSDHGDAGMGMMDPGKDGLTCISEEGLADMDFQDLYFDDWADYFGECITSCNKVENCLASEYDPDLMVERRARRWSAAKPSLATHAGLGIGQTAAALAGGIVGVHNNHLLIPPSPILPMKYPHKGDEQLATTSSSGRPHPSRTISIIDEGDTTSSGN